MTTATSHHAENRTEPATTPAQAPAGAIPSQATTPANVTIKPRNRSHDIAAALHTEWLDDDPFLTAVFNGMSITFPAGEKFFIDSVRHFRDDITDPVLQAHIRGFCGQEGFHTREHQRYNEALCKARGYDLAVLERRLTRPLDMARKHLQPIEHLAITVAIEHFTAVLADLMLQPGSALDKAEPSMRALWRWHAAEEMEHKSVAFDVYRAVGGTEAMRRRVMRRASFFVALQLTRALAYMLRKDGRLFSVSIWYRGLRDLFGKNGVFAGGGELYRAFYAEGFHPWEQDTQHLLDAWAAEAA